MPTIPLLSGTVPVTMNGPPTKQLTKSPKPTELIQPCLAKHLRTIAERTNVTPFLKTGKCTSKHLTTKEETS